MDNQRNSRIYEILLVATCLITTLIAMLVRLRYANMPFERDEGEYAYAGQLILKGIAPYIAVYNMKFPGTYLMYALFIKVLGQSIVAIRMGVLLLECLQYFFIYKTAKKLFHQYAGWIAVVTLAMLNLSMQAQAINTNAEHFVITFVIIGFYFMVATLSSPSFMNYFLAGIFFSIAVLMKQHAIYFLGTMMIIAAYQSIGKKQLKTFQAYLSGAMLPFGLMVAWLVYHGAFSSFKYWCFDYAREYISMVDYHEAWKRFSYYSIHLCYEYPLVTVAGALGLIFITRNREMAASVKVLVCLFVLASLASITPGFYFRQHYYILLFPAIGLLVGYGMYRTLGLIVTKSRIAATALTVVFCSIFFVQHYAYGFKWSNKQVLDAMYAPGQPFNVNIKIGSFIKSISADTDRVCCVLPDPEIYFYADRQSATPYIYIYPMLEDQKYAQAMTADYFEKVKAAKPKIMVMMDKGWLPGNHQDTVLYNFFNNVRLDYDLKGIMQLNPRDGVCNENFLTGSSLVDYANIPSLIDIKIYQRKNHQ